MNIKQYSLQPNTYVEWLEKTFYLKKNIYLKSFSNDFCNTDMFPILTLPLDSSSIKQLKSMDNVATFTSEQVIEAVTRVLKNNL